MAVKPLAADSKLVVYNNEVDLADKGVSQVYQGATIADVVAASGAGGATLVTSVPTFDATKIGERVYFNGEEWIYASQEWLQALGLDSLVSPGYALPVNMISSIRRVTDISRGVGVTGGNPIGGSGIPSVFIQPDDASYASETVNNITYDFRYLVGTGTNVNSNAPLAYNKAIQVVAYGYTGPISGTTIAPYEITKFEGVELLDFLEDVGTGTAFSVINANGLSQVPCDTAVIDDFFTRLPSTTRTATLNVGNFTGGAAANAAIAQAKGYTVIQ